MQRTILTPVLILAGILGVLGLMAKTPVFDPVVRYIYTGTIGPIGAGACLLLTVAGFAASYLLLNLLCNFFVPRIQDSSGSRE